jgi:hypothetical protein
MKREFHASVMDPKTKLAVQLKSEMKSSNNFFKKHFEKTPQ